MVDEVNKSDVADAVTELLTKAGAVESPRSAQVNDRRSVALSIDIESLDVGPRSVVTQVAMYGYDLDSGNQLPLPYWNFFPVQPQLDLLHPRTISAKTLWWWMKQSDEARALFEQSLDDDFGALPVLMRELVNAFKRMTRNGYDDYILLARGPQFDIVNIESLAKDCGFEMPWKYNTAVDLRTLLREAGMGREEESTVPKPHGFVAHQAGWDAAWQMSLYFEARRRIRSGR